MVSVAHATSTLSPRDCGPAGAPADWNLEHVHFSDVLSALNPLQYLPVVGMIYRETTGQTVHPAFRIAVSAVASLLLGGPIGLAATMIGAVISEVADGASATPDAGRMTEAARAYQHVGRNV